MEDDVSSHGMKKPAPASQPNTEVRPRESVCIEIQGRRLSIRTNHDPTFVHELANYVDAKLKTLQQAAPSAPLEKLLMLVSMTVAEELFSTKEELGALHRHVDERAQAMDQLLMAYEEPLD